MKSFDAQTGQFSLPVVGVTSLRSSTAPEVSTLASGEVTRGIDAVTSMWPPGVASFFFMALLALNSRWLLALRAGWLASLACCSSVFADEMIDLRTFSPPTAEQRVIKEPIVKWLVNAQAETFCANVPDKDGSVTRLGGCVYWKVSASSCTMVTTFKPSHSLLGHLFRSCLMAGR